MPMLLRREETGVEFDVFDDRSAVEEFRARGVDQSYERVANFRWSGDFQEAVAGMCGAAALAKPSTEWCSTSPRTSCCRSTAAIALAKRNLQTLVKPEAVESPARRPADIKQYLKPLLKQRNDLVLMGRCLMIRPIRHLRRGVFLDRTSDKYGFRVWRYIVPSSPVGVESPPPGMELVGYDDYIFLQCAKYGNHISNPCCSIASPRTSSITSDK